MIGRGDLLYTQGNDLTRIQCAFVDTPEVERIAEYIGSQKAYPEAHLLPEFVGEESAVLDIDASDRDALFREAAEVIVTATGLCQSAATQAQTGIQPRGAYHRSDGSGRDCGPV